jgi:hypothetical protein
MDHIASLLLQDVAVVRLISSFATPIISLKGVLVNSFKLGIETKSSNVQHTVCKTYNSHYIYIFTSSCNSLKKFDIYGHLHAQFHFNSNVNDVEYIFEDDKMFLIKSITFNTLHGGFEPFLYIFDANCLCEEQMHNINLNAHVDRPKSLAIWGNNIVILGFYQLYLMNKLNGDIKGTVDLKRFYDSDVVEYNRLMIHNDKLYLTFYGDVCFVQIIELKSMQVLQHFYLSFVPYRCLFSPYSDMIFLDLSEKVIARNSDSGDFNISIQMKDCYDGALLPSGLLCVVFDNTCEIYK